MRRVLFVLSSVACVAACGLEDGGLIDVVPASDVDSGADAIFATDGNKQFDVVSDQVISDTTPGPDTSWPCGVDPNSCNDTTAIPSGWTPVVTTPTNVACPAGFGTETHTKSAPKALPGACDCQAQNTMSPGCETGTIKTFYGGTCGTPGTDLVISNGGCLGLNARLDAKYASKTLTATGGGCTGIKVIDNTKLAATDDTICQATSCSEKVCAGQAPASFVACIEAANDVACPSNSPFKNKRVIGDPTLDCSACGSCVASASCDGAAVEFFTDGTCGSSLVSFVSDGTCQDTNHFNAFVGSVKYTANVKNPTYTANGPKTATVGLTNVKTLCCK